jgi:O-antigen ligase
MLDYVTISTPRESLAGGHEAIASRTRVADRWRRAAWTAAAVVLAVILSSLFYVDHVPRWVPLVCFGLAVLTAFRPLTGLVVVAVTTPVAWYVARQLVNDHVPWAEVLVVSVVLGWSGRRALGRETGTPPLAADAALLLGTVILSSIAAIIAVQGLTLGPALWPELLAHLARRIFIELRVFPGLDAGLVLLEGLALFGCAAAITRQQPRALLIIAIAVAAGAALAGAADVFTLTSVAGRQASFWSSFLHALARVRYHVTYADTNAAGSYFVMAVIVAVSAARSSAGATRGWVAACAVLCAAGLWISGSRAAMVGGVLAVCAACALRALRARRIRIGPIAVAAVVALGLLAGIALYMPLRGNQHSSATAVEARLGLAAAAGRMIAAHPVYGVGIGQFPRRAAEFVSPELLSVFPPAAHENAHNNFLQIAAELGLVGVAALALLLAVALRNASIGAAGDPLRAGVCTALAAFLITCIGGHPLLVREPSYAFWLLLGAAAGAVPELARRADMPRWRPALAVAILFVAAATPLRVHALVADADLEHMAVGLSSWQTSPDDIRYRAGTSAATLFVPANVGFTLNVQPLTAQLVHAELRLDGRVADVIALSPGAWNEIAMTARSERIGARYSRLDLRVVDGPPGTVLWLTKVRPRP